MRLAAAVAVVAAACGSSAPAGAPLSNNRAPGPPSHEQFATLERTACFGWCPIYKIAIYRDDAIEYDGERFVKTRGHATGKLAPEQIAALDALFVRHRFLALRDAYEDYSITDMPSVITSYAPPGGVTKTVRHYLGDQGAPKDLTEIEDGVDRIVHIEQWIGTDDERRMAHE